jgi:Flp pilus assembly protein TadD
MALQGSGKLDEAIVQFQKALELNPGDAKAHGNLGVVLADRGRFNEAMAHYQKALEIKPDFAAAHNGLAWLQATCPVAALRNGGEAVRHALRANDLSGGGQPGILDTLAAAYAEAGRFSEGVAAARKALELATQRHDPALADAVRARIALYEARKPYHPTPSHFAP